MIKLPTELNENMRPFTLHRIYDGETQEFVVDCANKNLTNVEIYVTIINKLGYTASFSESYLMHLVEFEIAKLLEEAKPVINNPVVVPYETQVSHPANDENCTITIIAKDKKG